MRRSLVGWGWISPWGVGFLAFMAIPLAMSLYYSFTEYPLVQAPLWVGTQNYRHMLGDGVFWKALRQTAIYCVLTIPLVTLASLVLAALLTSPHAERRPRLVSAVQAIVFVPTLVPLVATTMVWMWLFNGQYGLLNRAFSLAWKGLTALPRALGADVAPAAGPNWLLDVWWALPALLIINLWTIGQTVVLYVAAMRDVPGQLYEAASLDGMGPARRFLHVTLPMISPQILFSVITWTIGSLQAFVVPMIIFQTNKGGPDRVAYFYSQYFYDKAFVFQEMGYASALAWVQFLITLALTGLLWLASRRLVHYRGT